MQKLLIPAFLFLVHPVFGQINGPIKEKIYRNAIRQAERFTDNDYSVPLLVPAKNHELAPH